MLKHKIILALALLSLPIYAEEKPLPEACKSECFTPFGTELGKTKEGVIAYSNCRPSCVYESPVTEAGTYTGIRWQCVEFARRWLLKNQGMVFASVDYAFEIWSKIEVLEKIPSKEKVPLTNFPNGSKAIPKHGDLLIYAREYKDTGHVAVVLNVDRKRGVLEVGEENFLNEKWHREYARAIPFISRAGKIWVLDAFLLGWKRVAEQKAP